MYEVIRSAFQALDKKARSKGVRWTDVQNAIIMKGFSVDDLKVTIDQYVVSCCSVACACVRPLRPRAAQALNLLQVSDSRDRIFLVAH